ncbi:MAG: MBL fold metallo-hydrolase [Bacteroidota bacterium]
MKIWAMESRSFVLFLLLIPVLAYTQGRFMNVEIKSTQLTDRHYMLQGAGGNIGLYVGDEKVFMIDDQFAPLSQKIMAEIDSITQLPVSILVNTHWHGDHTGGNENFGTAGAMIIAHDNVHVRMSQEQNRGGKITAAAPFIALPVITFDEGLTFRDLEEPVMMIHVDSAHTDGDSFVWFPESNVLHMGDCFFHKRFPYIDLNSGGSFRGAISAVERALLIIDQDTQIIPGHGPMASMQDLLYYRTFLITIRDRMISELQDHKTREEINSAEIVAGYEELNWAFITADRFVDIVYASMTDE